MKLLKEDYDTGFIEYLRRPEIQELLNDYQIVALYDNLPKYLHWPQYVEDLTTILYKLDIDPLTYLDSIPRDFMCGLNLFENIILPANIQGTLGAAAFTRNTSLKYIDMSKSSITCIDDWAFRNCINLTTVHLPTTLCEIHTYAFDGCTNLQNIKLPQDLLRIGDDVFSDCSSLKEIVIPKKVKTIGMNCFVGCSTSLKVVAPKRFSKLSRWRNGLYDWQIEYY